MITKWLVETNRDSSLSRQEVKDIIRENNYTSIDVGAGVNFWSYPECTIVADILKAENFLHYDLTGTPIKKVFNLNLQNPSTWDEILSYVDEHGKFDFSICSHTIEDLVNPFEVVRLLVKISNRGFVAVPSKFDEFSFLYNNYFRGNPHHKYIFDVIDEKLHIFPKLGFIENNPESDVISNLGNQGSQLCIFWEESLDYFIFGDTVFYEDKTLISTFYDKLKSNLDETDN
jgi:hypothetical protein